MLSLAAMGAHIRKRLLRLVGDERAVSAVEFALLLPLMLTLLLGGVEVSQAVSVDRKVSLTARTLADLVARTTSVDATQMTDVLNAATAVIAPFKEAHVTAKISSVCIDAAQIAKIDWSSAKNTTARSPRDDVTDKIDAKLRTKNTYLVWAEVQYTYTPTIGYVITGSLPLSDQIFMRPRLSDKVLGPTPSVC